MSDDRLEALFDGLEDDAEASRTAASLFATATACAADPSADVCERTPWGIVATKSGELAARVWTTRPSCAESDSSEGWTAKLPGLSPEGRTPLGLSMDDLEKKEIRAIWTWVASLQKSDFAPARHLIRHTGELEAGIRTFEPVALLRAPLARWMLEAAGTSELAVALVSPDNARRYELGQVPFIKAKSCTQKERDDGECGDWTLPTLLDATLMPDGRTLVIVVGLSDGTHCGVDKLSLHVWPLPKAITPSPP